MSANTAKMAGARPPAPLKLRAGDPVVVRSKEEILATLDERGRFENLPFQPEMFAFCGKRLRVSKVAHKTCDTVNKTGGRSMRAAVHLEGARCDGSGHGGCEADCVFFWKEAWLRRPDDAAGAGTAPGDGKCTEAKVYERARAPGHETADDPVWVCQTTALFEATAPLAWWDFRQYIRDVATGNHTARHMARILIAAAYRRLVSFGYGYSLLIGLYDRFQKIRGGKPYPAISGHIPEGKPTPVENLGLKPGEWVEVKSGKEIAPTLTANGFNRGMRYDPEMLKYSGGRYRVEKIVGKLINEQTGKMMPMKTPCIQLEDVYCRAECTAKRLGCPRASSTYWREIWLKRAEDGKAA